MIDISTFFKDFASSWRASPDAPRTLKDALVFAGFGVLVGLAAGAVIAVFRIGTDMALAWSLSFAQTIKAEHGLTAPVLAIWFSGCALLAILTGFLIQADWPIHSGGMPWDRRALNIGYPRPWLTILLPKFLGSSIVMAAGLSVGREGPSIQMGAATALGIKERGGDHVPSRDLFVLGGCSAGLSSAFSAPLGGICFIFERMGEKITAPLLLFALFGGVGVYLSVVFSFGLGYIVPMPHAAPPHLAQLWTILPLALAAGLMGVAYAKLIELSLYLYNRPKRFYVILRPLLPFLGAGAMLIFYPMVNGEGVPVLRSVEIFGFAAAPLIVFLGVKIFFTAFCFGSGIPAGRMVPILVIGGVTGGVYATLMARWGLLSPECLQGCVMMGMCAAFAGSERAPVTGMALVLEMTGAWILTPAILVTSVVGALLGRMANVQ